MPAKQFMVTRSGVAFRYLGSGPEDVRLDDVAFHLSRICRFTGAVDGYTVAQHSVHASELVEGWMRLDGLNEEDARSGALHGLLHDAHEAYVGDVASPLKRLLRDYRDVEARVERVVHERFGIDGCWASYVKRADLTMLATEKRDLMPSGCRWDVEMPEPRAQVIKVWDAEAARERFLSRYWALMAWGVG